ncbi:MAG: hypothetical protein K2P80_14695 [Beijerinckiaceae bacterium]|nr:hypothetical protein [Beijerinckiaceae bacterium]
MQTQAAKKRDCGSCSLCCKLLPVAALYKPQNEWCKHCVPGKGCASYRLRPKACRDFSCLWLTEDFLDDSWKPSNSKFVMMWEFEEKSLTIVTDPKLPNAWKAEPYYTALMALCEKHLAEDRLVMLMTGEKRYVLLPDGLTYVCTAADKFTWAVTKSETKTGPHYHVEFQAVADEKTAAAAPAPAEKLSFNMPN